MPPKYPSFRKGRDGAPVPYDSDGARRYNESPQRPPRGPSQVDNDARGCVRGRGGDVSDRKDLLDLLKGGKKEKKAQREKRD